MTPSRVLAFPLQLFQFRLYQGESLNLQLVCFPQLSDTANSVGVPQQARWCATEFFKNATPDYLVRGTDLLSLRLSNKKMTTANESKLYLYFLSDWRETYLLVRCGVLLISSCAIR